MSSMCRESAKFGLQLPFNIFKHVAWIITEYTLKMTPKDTVSINLFKRSIFTLYKWSIYLLLEIFCPSFKFFFWNGRLAPNAISSEEPKGRCCCDFFQCTIRHKHATVPSGQSNWLQIKLTIKLTKYCNETVEAYFFTAQPNDYH